MPASSARSSSRILSPVHLAIQRQLRPPPPQPPSATPQTNPAVPQPPPPPHANRDDPMASSSSALQLTRQLQRAFSFLYLDFHLRRQQQLTLRLTQNCASTPSTASAPDSWTTTTCTSGRLPSSGTSLSLSLLAFGGLRLEGRREVPEPSILSSGGAGFFGAGMREGGGGWTEESRWNSWIGVDGRGRGELVPRQELAGRRRDGFCTRTRACTWHPADAPLRYAQAILAFQAARGVPVSRGGRGKARSRAGGAVTEAVSVGEAGVKLLLLCRFFLVL